MDDQQESSSSAAAIPSFGGESHNGSHNNLPALDASASGFGATFPSPSALGSSAISASSAPAGSPTALNPYAYGVYSSVIVENQGDGFNMKKPHSFAGQWYLPDQPSYKSNFSYVFNVTPGQYHMPEHKEGLNPKCPALPSAANHAKLHVPWSGSYYFSTQLLLEPHATKGKPGAMTLKIGGPAYPSPRYPDPAPQGVPNPLDLLMAELTAEGIDAGTVEDYLAMVGDGSNPVVPTIHWWGAYHPASGRLLALKYWRNANVPVPKVKKAAPTVAAGGARRSTGDPALADNARFLQASEQAKVIIPPKLDRLHYGEGVYESLTLEQKMMGDEKGPFMCIRNHKTVPLEFISPVDFTLFPKYPEVIKEPMCLDDVQRKLEQGAYADADAFERDMNLIWRNAKTFTLEKTASVVLNATFFEGEFEKAMKRFRRDLAKEQEIDEAKRKKEEERRAREERKAAEEAEKAERQRQAAERKAAALEAGEGGESKPKSVKKRSAPTPGSGEGYGEGMSGGEGGSHGAGGEGDGASVTADAAEGGEGRTPTARPSVGPPKAKKTRVDAGGGGGKGGGGGGKGGSGAGGGGSSSDITEVKAMLGSVTQALQMMAEMQAKQMAAAAAGPAFSTPALPFNLAQMQAMMANGLQSLQHTVGGSAPAPGPAAKKNTAPRKPRGKKSDEDAGPTYLTGDALDDALDDDGYGGGHDDDEEYKGGRSSSGGGGKRGRPPGKAARTTTRTPTGGGHHTSSVHPDSLPLTEAEKSKLSEDVSMMAGGDQEALITMLVEKGLVVPDGNGEVELDMNAISTPVLREMQRTVAEKLGRPVPHAALASSSAGGGGEKKGPGRPPGAGTFGGGPGTKEAMIANAARVAEASMDRIAALGGMNLGASAAGGGGGSSGLGGFGDNDADIGPPPL